MRVVVRRGVRPVKAGGDEQIRGAAALLVSTATALCALAAAGTDRGGELP